MSNSLDPDQDQHFVRLETVPNSCTDPESFVRGGPPLTTFDEILVCLFDLIFYVPSTRR